jgi:hypothetical protein
VIIQQQPVTSALTRSQNPDDFGWFRQEQLLALIADHLAAGNWQRGGGKKSKMPYPKPIERPGTRPTRFGKDPIPLDDMAAWLGWDPVSHARAS